ncbi:MAG: hypothetical protein WC728_01145 [Elusimicrobiota bacterium]
MKCLLGLLLPSLALASDFTLPQVSFEQLRGAALPQMGASAVAQAPSVLVELKPSQRMVGARTSWGRIPEGMAKSIVTVTVKSGDAAETLKDLTLEIVAPGKGELKRDGDRWVYTAFEEEKTNKHPGSTSVSILAKHKGRICSEPATLQVKSVFNHLTMFHSHDPAGKAHVATQEDYELAWQYAKWKYDIDTKNSTTIKYDKKLESMGATNPGAFNIGRHVRLGPTAFISENLCASVLGHENVHAGQGLGTFLSSKWSEPPAYQWELDNAERLGVGKDYVEECRAFQRWYQGTGPKPNF